MQKIAFIFPGQGSQFVGMGEDIVREYASASRMFEEASDVLGYSLNKMIFAGDENILKKTENTQPAILSTSMACLAPILEQGIYPDVVAGLSLGEYSAHVAAQSICFQDAVRVTRLRGKWMQEAVPEGVGTMAAIIGLSGEDVSSCCEFSADAGIVSPANFNCPGQVVIAGEIAAVRKAMELCAEKGAKRTLELPVSAPFHCSMMEPAAKQLNEELSKITIASPKIPVVTNVTGELVESNDIQAFLVKQVCQSVLWEKSILTMQELGINTFVEIGPGKVLSGFVKKTAKDVNIFNVGDIPSLQAFLKFMEESNS